MLYFEVTTRSDNVVTFFDKEAMLAISQFLNKEMICAVGHTDDSESEAMKCYIPFHAIVRTACEKDGINVAPADVLCGGSSTENP